MTDQSRAHLFAETLLELERSGDVEAMTRLFAPAAELRRPEVEASDRRSDAAEFWTEYLAPFTRVRTDFGLVREDGDLAVLEWESEGELRTGRPISYRGVSVLIFTADDRITRFTTYFDTAAFLDEGARGA